MNKFLFLFLGILFLNSTLIIADAPFDYRYHGDPHKSSVSYYQNNYYDYNLADYPSVPIFKGSYGDYRYQMYANGDYSPNFFFVDYPEYGFNPYFSGGYGNYYNYRGYGLGYYNYGYYPSYYGYNYYPSYSYSYII